MQIYHKLDRLFLDHPKHTYTVHCDKHTYDNLYSPQMVAEQQRKITTKS